MGQPRFRANVAVALLSPPESRRRLALACTTILSLLFAGSFSFGDEPTLPRPEMFYDTEIVESVHLVPIEDCVEGSVESALIVGDRLFLAGTRWNKEDTRYWMMAVTPDGQREWFQLLAEQRHNVDFLRSITLFEHWPPFRKKQSAPQIAFIGRRGNDTELTFVEQNGIVRGEQPVGNLEETTGAVVVSDDEIYLFGSGEFDSDALDHSWIARLNNHGGLVWKQPILFDDPPSEVGKPTFLDAPGKRLGGDRIHAGTILPDGSIAFIGEHRFLTSKFGTGPSDLFTIRIDRDGTILGRQTLADRRHCGQSRSTIVSFDGTIYTLSTPEDFNDVVRNTHSYTIELNRAGPDEDADWSQPVMTASMLSHGNATLATTGNPDNPLLIASCITREQGHLIQLQFHDAEGKLLTVSEVGISDELYFNPVIAIPQEGHVVIIAQGSRPREEGPKQIAILRVRTE